MAFTEAQRVKIRFYLGWSARFHQFDSRLEQAMNAVDADGSGETELQVEAVLTSLDAVTASLTAAHDRLKALAVGSIKLSGNGEINALRSEGRRHAGSLASTLGVEVRHDVFGSGRYRSFATHAGLVPGGGNVMLG